MIVIRLENTLEENTLECIGGCGTGAHKPLRMSTTSSSSSVDVGSVRVEARNRGLANSVVEDLDGALCDVCGVDVSMEHVDSGWQGTNLMADEANDEALERDAGTIEVISFSPTIVNTGADEESFERSDSLAMIRFVYKNS